MPYSHVLRNHCELQPAMDAIDGEISFVDGKDLSDAITLCHSDQSGICHIHRARGVLAHELAHPWDVGFVQREELNSTPKQHFPQGFLTRGNIGKHVHRFSHSRPYRAYRFLNSLESANTATMKVSRRRSNTAS